MIARFMSFYKPGVTLLHGLRLAISLGIKRLLVYGDSLLVVQRVNKEWDINKETMDTYVAEIRKLENKFSGLEIHHVVHDNNVAADVLSKLGSDRAEVPPGIFVHELHHPLINISTPMEVDPVPQETSREVMMIEADWRTTFIDYIKDKVLPPGIEKRRRRSSTHHASQQELHPCRQQTLQARRRIRNPNEGRHNRRRKRNPTRSL